MRPHLSLQIPYNPPATPDTVSPLTYTPLTERRRSLLSIAGSLHSLNSLGSLSSLNSLKPAKHKIQKYWPGSKSPTVHGDVKDWNTYNDMSTVAQLACDRGQYTTDNQRMQMPRDRGDPSLKSSLEQSIPRSVTHSSKQFQRKPVPPTMRAMPGLAAPQRAPPPPPIPELSAINYNHEDYMPSDFYELSAAQDTELFPIRRRAKTPVHRIGQLEMAALHRNRACGNVSGINRMSSVSTIAREYRDLVDSPEVPDATIHYTHAQDDDMPSIESGAGFGLADHSPPIGIPASPAHHNLHLSSSVSDDGTLLGSEPDTTHQKHLSTSSDGVLNEVEEGEEIAPSSLRFQIGLQLLTKELSAALASRCQTDDRSSAGLQVWVMIEAYERLRDQLEATGSEENKEARLAIDSWLKALYAIHSDIACDGATGDSDYESS